MTCRWVKKWRHTYLKSLYQCPAVNEAVIWHAPDIDPDIQFLPGPTKPTTPPHLCPPHPHLLLLPLRNSWKHEHGKICSSQILSIKSSFLSLHKNKALSVYSEPCRLQASSLLHKRLHYLHCQILREQTTSPETWQQCNRTGKPQTVHKAYITTECPENCYWKWLCELMNVDSARMLILRIPLQF